MTEIVKHLKTLVIVQNLFSKFISLALGMPLKDVTAVIFLINSILNSMNQYLMKIQSIP